MVSVGEAPQGMRWFHANYPEEERWGPWHLGVVPAGKTWPAGRALCGFEQRDVAVGGQTTAPSVLAQAGEFCGICLDAYKSLQAGTGPRH